MAQDHASSVATAGLGAARAIAKDDDGHAGRELGSVIAITRGPSIGAPLSINISIASLVNLQ